MEDFKGKTPRFDPVAHFDNMLLKVGIGVLLSLIIRAICYYILLKNDLPLGVWDN